MRTGSRPIVALHGLIGSGACLLPLGRAFLADFDVLLPDARGHGFSSAPDTGYLYDTLARDVVETIKELGLDAPVLLGHSMGGLTAAVAAAELGSDIAALVLVDPTFISLDWQREVFESEILAEHERALKASRTDLLEQARLRSPGRFSEIIEHLVDARLRTSSNAFEVLTPPNPDWRELARSLRVPTLLLIADAGVVSPDTARELRGLNHRVQVVALSNAKHGVVYDEPERVGADVVTFLHAVCG